MTKPILILPIAMHAAFVIGLLIFGAFAILTYAGAVAKEGTAFYALVYTFFALLQTADPGVGIQPFIDFVSGNGLILAMDGAKTLEFLGLATIALLIAVLVALATAYTRAMVITVAADAADGKRTGIIDLFRGARARWMPSFLVFLPVAVLVTVIAMTSIPALIANIHYAILGVPTPPNPWVITRLVAIVLLAGYLAKTVFADGVIAHGSRKPIRESIAYLVLKWQRGLAAIALLVGVTGIVLALDVGRSLLLGVIPMWLSLVLTAVFFALVAVWRLWTTAFVVRLSR